MTTKRIPLPLASKRLAEVYSRLPTIACKGLCHDQCTVILMSALEWQRLKAAIGGKEPEPSGMDCPMLSEAKTCRVYDVRPFVCRAYGLSLKIRCPHGCEPDRWLSDEEAVAILKEIHKLNHDQQVYCTHDRRMLEKTLGVGI